MDARLQRRVQRYGWDRASRIYERSWRDQLEPAQDLLLDLAALCEGERVLDVACGTGLVTLRAWRMVGARGRVVGVDLSEEMIRIASERMGAYPGAPRFERAGAEDLPFEEGSFDATLCALGLMYLPDVHTALLEQRRVLRPGGRTAIAVWGARERCGWAEVFPIVDQRVRSEVCPLFFQLGTGDNLRNALARAGFEPGELRRIRTTLRYRNTAEALEAAFVGGPVALAHSRFDDEARNAAHAEYLESIEPYRRGDGYLVPGEFVVGLGTKIES